MTFTKTALVLSLGLAALGAMAGEIKDTTVNATGAENKAFAEDSKAFQSIGFAKGSNARIHNSTIDARGAVNHAHGRDSVAEQHIGAAFGNGHLHNVNVQARRVRNEAVGRALGDARRHRCLSP